VPFFTKKYNLLKVWQKIKQDAQKARVGHGGKPGGKMGFEDKITALDKAATSSDPKPADVIKQAAALSKEMASYGAKLPPAEAAFAQDIVGFVKLIQEIGTAAAINEKEIGLANKKLLAARMNVARVNQVCDGVHARLLRLQKQLVGFNGTEAEMKALVKEITEEDKEVQKLGKEMGDHFAVVMELT
jgi:hypothetical protein